MYRIELRPGEVTVFRTIEELATGVRNGVISPKARIYHNASQKWLPIEFHPHYKAALELLAGRPAETPAPKPAERPSFEKLSFLNNVSGAGGAAGAAATKPAPSPSDSQHEPASHEPAPRESAEPPVVRSTPITPARGSSQMAQSPFSRPAPEQMSTTMLPPARPTNSPATQARTPLASFLGTAELEADDGHEPTSHATMLELPRAEAPPRSLPPVSASPVLELPRISYPEFTPAEQPVPEPASPARPRRRTVQVAGALLVLAVGGYAATLVLAPAREGARAPAAVTAAEPIVERHPAPSPAARPRPASSAAASTAQDAPLPPASSGFAPALESRAIVSAPPKDGKPATPADSLPSVAPAPIDLDLSVPALSGADPLAGTERRQSDSALKKILRAVNGGKDVQTRP